MVVTVGGIELGSYLPDETGGVLVHVPAFSAVQAARGAVRSVGSNAVLECGVVASRITIQGAGVTAPMAARCLA